MGYSGSINFNGISLFSEGKCDGRYCMDYAENFNKQKPAKLTIKSIEECIKNINGGVNSYTHTIHCIRSAGYIIEKLGGLLDGGFESYFDEDGNFLLIAKEQNADRNGNSTNINYYKKNKVSEVPEVKESKRMFLSNEDMEDMKIKRRVFIETINVFSTLDGLRKKIENHREIYDNYVSKLKNIKTRNDVFVLLEEMNMYYQKLNEVYYKKYTFALKLTKMLESCKVMIKNGEEVFAKCKGSELYLYSSKKYANIEYDTFFDIADLFTETGTSTGGSNCYITTLEDFKILVESFEYMQKEKRSPYIEKMLKDQYEVMNTGSRREFKLSIGGGY